jgi:heat shock protein HslJ
MLKSVHVARLAGALALSLAAPGGPALAQDAPTTWVLEKGHNIPARPPRTPSLRVEGDKLSGSTGCNLFTARISKTGDQGVAIDKVALTRKLCAAALNEVEAAVVTALEQTRFVETKDSRLSFLSAGREPLLVWTRPENAAAPPPVKARRIPLAATHQAKPAHRVKVHRAHRAKAHRTHRARAHAGARRTYRTRAVTAARPRSARQARRFARNDRRPRAGWICPFRKPGSRRWLF